MPGWRRKSIIISAASSRHLRQSGRWADTLIVFTADHGEQLFDHWMLGKTGYFDQSAHIPLIIVRSRAPPMAARGRTVSAFSESIDVMPTILGRAGLKSPRNGDGRSLLPFCAGETPRSWRDEVHWSFDFRDIRTKRLERRFGLPSDWCNLQVRAHRPAQIRAFCRPAAGACSISRTIPER